MENRCAVILGGYVNGYSIIQELSSFKVENIALIHYGKQLASYSNKLNKKIKINKTKESLLIALHKLNREYEYLVLFPTDDLQLENLLLLKKEISSFCFLPFNDKNLLSTSNKAVQYKFCEELGIPYPKTVEISKVDDLLGLEKISFPIIVKPNKREDLKVKVFRSITINSNKEIESYKQSITGYIDKGLTFIASEIIPGDTNGSIYAYTAYRSPKSAKIENEWIGKKLTQFPNDYGVFSSSSNKAPDIIKKQGRLLLDGMNLYGICEPEFKFDYRDNKYKLMEINLRSMMWHRTGNLSGVYLQYTQWCDAIGIKIEHTTQSEEEVYFSYLKHEILNLIFKRKYLKYFKSNLLSEKRNIALFDREDLKPFIVDQLATFLDMFKTVIKKIINKK
ncbi:putative ATP-grasp superfamily ATP-dependent carboligase [Cellulophaga sp. RHA_52]|uniref:hypothetical protein n=1 Tax=Cellulophaga sp. RHA_52 TaxID=1250036 RepID=UPI00119BE15B|nr:hypothetical protein [Cellulophaga sp. RHA_52]TVZ08248.1 putative ATP-grasp superfamily ATP-dependent carboligase [Cellulophaga sp. RHA_52]